MLYIHVGLHKTGTTYVQNALFPKWHGLVYLPTTNLEHFLRMDPTQTYLVSREGLSGLNWSSHEQREQCLARLSEIFPQAKILISFRNHAGYIVSSYRQYLQRGGTLEFEQYFDMEGDQGFLKRDDFLYQRKIDSIERLFGHRPFVFAQEEINNDLPGLLLALEGFLGGTAPKPEEINYKAYNKSVGYYPAALLRRLNRLARSQFNPTGRYNLYSRRLVRWHLDPRSICQYGLSFLPDRPFLTDQAVARINAYYQDDWAIVEQAIQARQRAGEAIGAEELAPSPS